MWVGGAAVVLGGGYLICQGLDLKKQRQGTAETLVNNQSSVPSTLNTVPLQTAGRAEAPNAAAQAMSQNPGLVPGTSTREDL
jgi:hypothetical protein